MTKKLTLKKTNTVQAEQFDISRMTPNPKYGECVHEEKYIYNHGGGIIKECFAHPDTSIDDFHEGFNDDGSLKYVVLRFDKKITDGGFNGKEYLRDGNWIVKCTDLTGEACFSVMTTEKLHDVYKEIK